ncbi:MAG TPA: molybdopterin-binding protein, partial [Rubrivivax sp.]
TAAADNDLIVTSGGVSVGEEDHLRPAMEAEGRIEHWQIAMKPGKPLAFGSLPRSSGAEALFVGLPGNPVSSFVTYLVAAVPLLRAIQGLPNEAPATLALRADFDWLKPDRRREFLRVRRNAGGGLELFPNQSSGVLTSAVWADGLLDNPPGQAIRRGDTVSFLPLPALIAR